MQVLCVQTMIYQTLTLSLYGFIQRLSVSQNSIVLTIEQSWLVRLSYGKSGPKFYIYECS